MIPDLDELKSSVESLETALTTTIMGELELFMTQLSALEAEPLNVISLPLQKLTNSEKWLIDFKSELQDTIDAVNVLDPYVYPSLNH